MIRRFPKYSWNRVERSALDSLKGSAHSAMEQRGGSQALSLKELFLLLE